MGISNCIICFSHHDDSFHSSCHIVQSGFCRIGNELDSDNDKKNTEICMIFFWTGLKANITSHSTLQKRERTGKEYGCFRFVRKTRILK